ncbi:putative MYND domain protein [Dissophora ornata]|nr:putative MYND domain protein [Dissophora ornata]
MADSNTTTTLQCANCAKASTESGNPLKRCAKCKTVNYCSRECQLAHWKIHKKVCASNAQQQQKQVPGPTSSSSSSSSSSSRARKAPKGLSVAIDKPFHQLHAKKWLHGRSEQDVFKLLIDTYRLRLDDDYKYGGDADTNSIYGGAPDGREGFLKFLVLAENQRALLPSWWSKEKANECVTLGMEKEGWSSLANPAEKADLVEHYGDPLMPMQLRMFGEQVYGTGPGGMSGAAMLQAQMMGESGRSYTSTFGV